MPVQLLFGVSVAFGFLTWGLVAERYIWPVLRARPWLDAMRAILILHGFRFLGLAFLVPGVVSPDLSATFAVAAGYGDLVAAILALATLATLPGSLGIGLAWVFNIWGSFDLLNAFYLGITTVPHPGQFGAAYFIPTAVVPLLLITHGLMFRLLLQHRPLQSRPGYGT